MAYKFVRYAEDVLCKFQDLDIKEFFVFEGQTYIYQKLGEDSYKSLLSETILKIAPTAKILKMLQISKGEFSPAKKREVVYDSAEVDSLNITLLEDVDLGYTFAPKGSNLIVSRDLAWYLITANKAVKY